MIDEPEHLASRRDDITHPPRPDNELDLEFTVFLAQTDLTISDAIRMPRELDRKMRVFMERAGLSVSDALRTLLVEGLHVRGVDLFSEKRAAGKVA